MVLNYLFSLLILGAIYAYTFPDSQLATTTSAIRQIWSGSCRLSCRPSEYSGYSGLSGLVPGHLQHKACCVSDSIAGPSTGCICETCPCALIENVLRTCQPATTLYSSIVELIATCCYSLFEMIFAIYNYLERVFNCRTSCQRIPQLVTDQDSNSDNIYFGTKKHRDSVEKAKHKRSDTGLRTSIAFKDISDVKNKHENAKNVKRDEEGKESDVVPKTGDSDATLKAKGSKSSDESNSCPKCLEKGKVCMKKCPKAYVNKKK